MTPSSMTVLPVGIFIYTYNDENLLEFRLKIGDGFTCYVFVRRSDLSAAVCQYITRETTRQMRRVLYIPMYLTTLYILGQQALSACFV